MECYSELSIPKRLYLPRCDNTLVHDGTWDSLVHEFENYGEYQKAKQETLPQEFEQSVGENIQRWVHLEQEKIIQANLSPGESLSSSLCDLTQYSLFSGLSFTSAVERYGSHTQALMGRSSTLPKKLGGSKISQLRSHFISVHTQPCQRCITSFFYCQLSSFITTQVCANVSGNC